MAAAAGLRSAGHEVEVFEANSYFGGKLTAFEQAGYRFDMGPSLFTVPHFLDEVFTLSGKNPRDYYSYQRIDPGCHYFWEDGTRFNAPSDPTDFAEKAEKTFGADPEKIKLYFKKAFELYDITEDVFLKSSLHKASTFLKTSTMKSMAQLYKAKLFSTMHEVNDAGTGHPKLTQLFDRYATYNGSDPYKAPGTLTVIPTLEHRWGTFLPKGGMHEISKSLHRLCTDLGVVFHFDSPVEEITVENGAATGIKTADKLHRFDKVVSNMDVVPTYRRLLKDEPLPGKIEKQERSSSALIFYWGVRGKFADLGLHNILWSDSYREEFRCLFDTKTLHNDPTVYVNITSKYVPGDAPTGCENWFVMLNAPHTDGQDWDAVRKTARKLILEKLKRMLGTDIEPLIETERVLDPPGIEAQTSSHLGSLYGTSSNSTMSAFLRHPNFTGKVKNLYFCGGSVHPGGGIPLCLLSGKIVSDLAG